MDNSIFASRYSNGPVLLLVTVLARQCYLCVALVCTWYELRVSENLQGAVVCVSQNTESFCRHDHFSELNKATFALVKLASVRTYRNAWS